MGMIDIELKGVMDEYSDPSLRSKIYKCMLKLKTHNLKTSK